jgi:hypothetical protein
MAKGTDKRQRHPEPGVQLWISDKTMRTLVRALGMLVALLTGAGAGLLLGC